MIGNWKPEGRRGCKGRWHAARKKHQAWSGRVAQSARFHIARLKEKGISHFLNYRSRSTNDRTPSSAFSPLPRVANNDFPHVPTPLTRHNAENCSDCRFRTTRTPPCRPRPYRRSGPKQRILESAAASAVIALLATSHAAFSTPNLHPRTARRIRQLYRK